MAIYSVSVTVPASDREAAEAAFAATFPGATVEAVGLPRPAREALDRARSLVEDAASTVESLKDEFDSWYDNLPESFQSGDKGSELEECRDGLETLHDELEEIDFEAALELFPTDVFSADVVTAHVVTCTGTLGRSQQQVSKRAHALPWPTRVRKVERVSSRADQLGEAEQLLDEARELIEELSSRDGKGTMPAPTLSDATLDTLRELASALGEPDFGSIDFPGMY